MFGKNKQSAFWSTLRPQTGFWLGLVLGVLLMFVVGFFVLLGLVINQEKNAAAADDNVAAAADQVSAVNLSPIGKDEPVQGDRQAKVVLIEFSDFQCPYCARVHETLKELVSEYGDKIAWVYRSFPLDSIHAYARSAAEASECASDQDKFWEYADALYTNQDTIANGREALVKIATDLGLNVNKFTSCLDSGKYSEQVEADFQEGLNNGVTGTPVTFVNGQLVKGAQPLETFEGLVDQALQ